MEIKNIKDTYTFYLDLSEINYIDKSKAYLPQTLRISLSEPFLGKSSDVEIEAIGQCIVQKTRPRILNAPLQFGLGVQMHHHFGSRFLIENLYSHGFCLSYQEVLIFSKASGNFQTDTNILTPGHFSHFS